MPQYGNPEGIPSHVKVKLGFICKSFLNRYLFYFADTGHPLLGWEIFLFFGGKTFSFLILGEDTVPKGEFFREKFLNTGIFQMVDAAKTQEWSVI